ncbi:phosphoenolpyruvate-protein phosphotransferase [gamma proteobacterium HTCC5015]|nr:phosphoenolpyruvate-protein phosphotransferase [gamma proteobacterium HTCC5015]
MLSQLRSITQEASAAKRLDDALGIIIDGVQSALSVDAVSVYLAEEHNTGTELVLRASKGLKSKAIGKIRMRFGEGLVGTVAERAEPLNLDHAAAHPHFKYFPETGEESFHSFLGAPIINYGQTLGVLVVQQRTPRLFDEDHVAFLITLAAQLGASLSQAAANQDFNQSRSALLPKKAKQRITGLAGSPGIVIGEAVVTYSLADLKAVPDRSPASIPDEIRQFERAIASTQEDMRRIADTMRDVLPSEEVALFEAYEMMVQGGPIVDDTLARIRRGNWAQGALRETVSEHLKIFRDVDDPYLRERAEDIHDLGRRILMHLQSRIIEKRHWPRQTVLVGDSISPTQLAEVPPERLAGIVSVHGSGSSHVSILARAMQIPAVMGVRDLPTSQIDGSEIILDGYAGHLYINPSWALKREYSRLIKQEKQQSKELTSLVNQTAVTTDGVRINLLANTGLISDLTPCLKNGAEGIGLYRTEVPFQIRSRFPSEEEQYDIYRQVLESFAPRPVVIRTLDIGGDKPLEYFPIQEDNPFLGWRGIRITLDHPEIFLTQLRAMLRANQGLGNLRIMLPMVSSIRELYEAKQLVLQAHSELLEEGSVNSHEIPRIGVMIEVPSAIYLVDALAAHVDFFSIGTNDLTQYLLAVDRNNDRVAKLYDSLHPSVLHAILHIADAAQRHNKPVSVCGELAGDPLGALCLMGMGVHSLSMNAGSLSKVKKVIRSFSAEDSQDIVSGCLTLEDGAAVRQRLQEELEAAHLGGLIRPGL